MVSPPQRSAAENRAPNSDELGGCEARGRGPGLWALSVEGGAPTYSWGSPLGPPALPLLQLPRGQIELGLSGEGTWHHSPGGAGSLLVPRAAVMDGDCGEGGGRGRSHQ
jgi:hypothetical protein